MASALFPSIHSFLESMRLDRGVSDLTLQAYERDLKLFAATLPATSGVLEISSESVQGYLGKLSEQKLKPSSVARKVSALRQFFKFCCLEQGLQQNPMESIASPKLSKLLPKAISEEEISRLLGAADEGLAYPRSQASTLQARDRAMVYLLYASGLRVSELIGIQLHDLQTVEGYVRVQGKGGKERIVPFAPVAGERVIEFLQNHRSRLNPTTEHLFIGERGFALTRQALWKTLKELSVKAGISAPLSPHVLRHSFATHLLQSGMNLRSLQMLLGHADLSTTQIYTQVTPAHLKRAHRKFHPRGE